MMSHHHKKDKKEKKRGKKGKKRKKETIWEIFVTF